MIHLHYYRSQSKLYPERRPTPLRLGYSLKQAFKRCRSVNIYCYLTKIFGTQHKLAEDPDASGDGNVGRCVDEEKKTTWGTCCVAFIKCGDRA